MINRFVQSKRTMQTTILAIVPAQFKTKLETLFKGKGKNNAIQKQLHLLEFPFEFAELLRKIATIVTYDSKDNLRTKTTTYAKSQTQLPDGKLLFDIRY